MGSLQVKGGTGHSSSAEKRDFRSDLWLWMQHTSDRHMLSGALRFLTAEEQEDAEPVNLKPNVSRHWNKPAFNNT